MRCIGRSVDFDLERLKLDDSAKKEKRVLNGGEEL
jgi:hypothetical protein